ncbi:eIF-2-alpha kinase GCN2 [Liparis tanakae]|uniref:eIF-2-alpha kinase GCN2 n=1 Tax=Liparis tanakae TaxID=230148 RepID=A0A4Z2JB30_9TELE|nr:eIF-2-alpha kinase GCN2 [Liparis tanakae]
MLSLCPDREISESMSQNPKGSLLNTTGSSEQHGSSSTTNINVNVISPDKVPSSVRRRYETQIQTRLQNLSTNLQNKSNDIEVLAVDLLKETLVHFLTLEFESEEQFNSSVKTLLYRLPKQRYLKSICDEIHQLKMTKNCHSKAPGEPTHSRCASDRRSFKGSGNTDNYCLAELQILSLSHFLRVAVVALYSYKDDYYKILL